jgi:hypothetical protein
VAVLLLPLLLSSDPDEHGLQCDMLSNDYQDIIDIVYVLRRLVKIAGKLH